MKNLWITLLINGLYVVYQQFFILLDVARFGGGACGSRYYFEAVDCYTGALIMFLEMYDWIMALIFLCTCCKKKKDKHVDGGDTAGGSEAEA